MQDVLAFLGGIGVVVATTVVTTIVVELIFKPSLEIRKERKLDEDRRRRAVLEATQRLVVFYIEWLGHAELLGELARMDERRWRQLRELMDQWRQAATVGIYKTRKAQTASALVNLQVLRLDGPNATPDEAVKALSLDAQMLLDLMRTPRWKVWRRLRKHRSPRLRAARRAIKQQTEAATIFQRIFRAVETFPPHAPGEKLAPTEKPLAGPH